MLLVCTWDVYITLSATLHMYGTALLWTTVALLLVVRYSVCRYRIHDAVVLASGVCIPSTWLCTVVVLHHCASGECTCNHTGTCVRSTYNSTGTVHAAHTGTLGMHYSTTGRSTNRYTIHDVRACSMRYPFFVCTVTTWAPNTVTV